MNRKTFTLPRDIRFGRYPDEHPYWNTGSYRKISLDDEFCNESYYANQFFTIPRPSLRKKLPRRTVYVQVAQTITPEVNAFNFPSFNFNNIIVFSSLDFELNIERTIKLVVCKHHYHAIDVTVISVPLKSHSCQ